MDLMIPKFLVLNKKMQSKNHFVSFKALGYSKQEKQDLIDTQDMVMNQEMLNRITVYCSIKKNIKRGDTISLLRKNKKYRNDWTFMWDGREAVDLGTQYDEYGHVPRRFEVGDEFQPNHWHLTITHNQIFHLSDETKNQMKFVQDEHGYMYSDVVIGKILWRCYIDPDDETPFDINRAYFSMDEGNLEGEIDVTTQKVFFAYMPVEH